MKTGTIVRSGIWIGVLTGRSAKWKDGLLVLFGNETRQFQVAVNPAAITPIEIIDLTPDEREDVLHLMQALVLSLVEDKEPF